MKNLLYIFFIAISIGAFSCTQDSTPPPVGTNLAAIEYKNVAYGIDPLQKMDIYLPQGRSKDSTPFMVLIHGGGWMSGDKADFDAYITSLKLLLPNYAFFNINYRLASLPQNNVFPTQELDVKAAIDFINIYRSSYQVSDKMVLFGASAGGHLSLMQGYKYASPIKAKAIVNYFGPSDVTTLYYSQSVFDTTLIKLLMSGSPTSNPTAYFQASPINYINQLSPPTLTLQGSIDPIVPVAQQTRLHAKLDSLHVPNRLQIYTGEGHGWGGTNLVHSFSLVQQFLNQHVR